MADDWDDNASYPGLVYSNVPTQVYRNSNENGRSNWRDKSRQDFDKNSQENRRDGYKGNNRNPRRTNNEDATVIKVPSKFVGRIIGRGGSKISDLQFESGARINVTKETDGDQTIVKLIGSEDAVAKAESMIQNLTIDRDNYHSNHTQDNRNNFYANNHTQEQRDNFFGNNQLQGHRDNFFGNNQTQGHRDNFFANNQTQGHRDNFFSQEQAAPEEPSVTETPPKEVNWRAVFQACDDFEKEEWAKLPPIQKQFYVEHPEVTAMTEDEVAEFRAENNNIVVERTFKTEDSKPVPKPVVTFEHAFHQYPGILKEIEKAGFTKPSPIQCQAWPVLLSGEDLIGIAQTGTGKTLAFLLPALIHIDGQIGERSERGGPSVLVMAPTRELALQIDKEVKKYEYKGITAVCVYGGGNRREQIKVVTEGVDIVIATPGRLNDLVEAGHLNVKFVTYVVLDEADRMLDMGFEPQIRKVMYTIRPTRQTVMTSATWPPGVRRLAQSYMVDPIQIYVGTLDLAATHTVTQIIEIMPDDDQAKFATFMEFVLNLDPSEKVIVFCGKKARADELSSELVLAGIQCQTIHGNREQSDREQALIDIADGTVQILIATDVASRGLDIDDITHVINYDFPRNIEEYVHRVGRTGRAGKSGKSISYVTRGDWAQAKDLIAILQEAQQYVPDEVYKMAERYAVWKEKKDSSRPSGRGRGGGGGRRW